MLRPDLPLRHPWSHHPPRTAYVIRNIPHAPPPTQVEREDEEKMVRWEDGTGMVNTLDEGELRCELS